MQETPMFEKLRPLGDRVLVKRVENEEKTQGGIYIPDSAQERAQLGEVIAVGGGKIDQLGNARAVGVKVGDTIFFGKYTGTEAGKTYLIVREDEILGVLEK
jgi:chaperonin GroES